MADVAQIEITAKDSASAVINNVKTSTERLTESYRSMGGELSKTTSAANDAAHGLDKLNFSTVGARREMVVMLHELSQGNWRGFAGSAMVFAERIDAMSAIMSGAGLAAGAMLAAVAAVTAAIVIGARESDKFNKTLTLTGNFAGITQGQFNAMARDIAGATDATIGASRAMLQGFVAMGQYAGPALDMITRAALKFGEVSGQDAEDVLKDFSSMSQGVAKWAEEHNSKYHYLTATQYEYIRDLEKQGDVQRAVLANAKALYDHLGDEAPRRLGILERAWQSVRSAMSSAWDGMKSWGRDDTVEDRISKAQAAIAVMQERQKAVRAKGYLDAEIGRQQAIIDNAQEVQRLERLSAAHKAADAAIQDAGVKASKTLEDLHNKYMSNADKEAQEVAQYRKAIADRIAAGQGGVDSEAKQAQTLAAIHDAYKTKTAERVTAYDTLLKTIHEKLAIQDTEASNDAKLTDGQKLAAKAMADLANGTLKATAAQKLYVTNLLERLIAEEKSNEIRLAMIKAADDLATAGEKEIRTTEEQIAKQQEHNEQIGLSKAQIDAIANTRLRESAAADMQSASNLRNAATVAGPLHDAYLRYADDLDKVARNKLKLADLKVEAAVKDGALEQTKLMRTELDELSRAAQGMASTMETSFGRVAGAIGQIAAVFAKSAKDQFELQQRYQDEIKAANGDQDKVTQAQDKLRAASAQAQIQNYADIAGAAKNLFDAHSKGYAVMQKIEQVYRAFQIAMAMESMAKQLLGIQTVTSAQVAGNATQTTSLASSAVQQIASLFGIGQAAAATGVATQAIGDPYTAWARMAAMAAVMVGLGFAVSAGGGSNAPDANSAASVQKLQGTGTVFGDAEAKSDSIAKSMDLLTKNSSAMLPLTSSMANSLRNMEASMAGLTNMLLRTPGSTDASNFNIAVGTSHSSLGKSLGEIGGLLLGGPLGGLLGGIVGNFIDRIWGHTTTNVTDTGLQFGGSVGQLQQGQGFNQYANVHTDSSSWFGLVHSSSDNVQTAGISQDLAQQFGLIFQNLQTTLQDAAKGLGKSSDTVGAAVQNFVLDTTKISLQGLKGQDLQNALNAVISGAMDKISQSVFPELTAFQQVGEGYTQTVIRVANGIESAGAALDKLGITAIKYSDIVNKQGDVGAEIIRQSVANIETVAGKLSGVGQIIQNMAGTVDDLIKEYTALVAIRQQMASVGMNGKNLSAAMILGAGDESTLSSGLSAYFSNYFTDAERAAAETKAVADQFAKLGLQMPGTKDDFRKLVEGIDTSTDAGAKLAGQVLALADSFNTAANDAQKAADAAIASAKASADAAQKAVDSARANLTAAYNAESGALQSTIDKMKAFAQATAAFRDSLKLGSLSTLSPEQQYTEAHAQYASTLASARAGDVTAQGQLQTQASAFLNASRAYNASTAAYAKDFDLVQQDLTATADSARTQAEIAQDQLNVLNQQVSGLIDINKGVLSVADAIKALQAALLAQRLSPSDAALSAQHGGLDPNAVSTLGDVPVGTLNRDVWNADAAVFGARLDGSHAAGLDFVPFDGYRAQLHQGEMVLTAAQAQRVRAPADDKATIAELRAQTQQLRTLVSVLAAGHQALDQRLANVHGELTTLRKKARMTHA